MIVNAIDYYRQKVTKKQPAQEEKRKLKKFLRKGSAKAPKCTNYSCQRKGWTSQKTLINRCTIKIAK